MRKRLVSLAGAALLTIALALPASAAVTTSSQTFTCNFNGRLFTVVVEGNKVTIVGVGTVTNPALATLVQQTCTLQ